MMSRTTPQRRLQVAAGVIAIAAGASVAGIVGITPTVSAAPDAYVAVSVGLLNDNPPVQTVGGIAIGPDADQARIASLSDCQNKGGNHCVFETSKLNGCAAAAANDLGEIEAATEITLRRAEENARAKLQNQQGMHIVIAGCSNGDVETPPPPPPSSGPPPTPAPLLGPTVSFKTIVGGREAHITDRSGVSSQCTYTADNYTRAFALPANSSYDLQIVPAVPQFKNWNITIACDNGATTTTTDYF